MAKKRTKENGNGSSSSDAKRRRSSQNGEKTSTRTFQENNLHMGDSIIRELRKIKDTMQAMEEKIVKLENQVEKKTDEIKELLRLQKENLQQMHREGSTEVLHYNASSSQRSPPDQGQTTTFNLKIESKVGHVTEGVPVVYKGKTIPAPGHGNLINIVLYDGPNRIAPTHPLSKVTVQLVVIQEGFSKHCDLPYWPKGLFEEYTIKEGTREEKLANGNLVSIVQKGIFRLSDGKCAHEGAVITMGSNRKNVMLGVMIAEHSEHRVLEGVSNLFKVQEAKTEKSRKRKGSSADNTAEDKRQSCPADIRQTSSLLIADPRQAPNGNGQECFQQDQTGATLPPQPTRTQIMQYGQAPNGNGQECFHQYQTGVTLPPQPTRTQTMQHGQAPNSNGQECFHRDQTGATLPPQPQYGQCDHLSDIYLPLNAATLQGYSGGQSSTTSENIFRWEDHIFGGSLESLHPENTPQDRDYYHTSRRVELLWDKPNVEPSQRWNLLDQLMPLYTTHSRICSGILPSACQKHKVHISPDDSIVKMMWGLGITSSRAMQTSQRRGVLIQPIDSYDESSVKQKRHAKYLLRIVNRACSDYYTWERIKADDGKFLKVALYDVNNLRITTGQLSSASVEVVLLHGDFNAHGHDYWSSDEFNSCILCPQSGKVQPALGGDRVLVLTDGEANLSNSIFRQTSFHARTGKFKIGVRMIVNLEGRVQEGITEPFLVRNCQGGGYASNSNSPLGESPIHLGKKMLLKDHTTPAPERDAFFSTWNLLRLCDKDKDKVSEEDARVQLRFLNCLKSSVYTARKITAEDGGDIKIAIFRNGKIITSGPLSSVSIEILALHGDFIHAGNHGNWTEDEFGGSIVISRGRSMLQGDVILTLENGVAYIRNVRFMKVPSKTESGRFMLAARVCRGGEPGIRVKEAVMNPVEVQVSPPRNSYGKYDRRPKLTDEVYRLPGISKNGVSFRRLHLRNIYTVQDFRKALNKDADKIRNECFNLIKDSKRWEAIVKHAKECDLEGNCNLKSYIVRDKNVALFFNCVHDLVGAEYDGCYIKTEHFHLSQLEIANWFKKRAFHELDRIEFSHEMKDDYPIPLSTTTNTSTGVDAYVPLASKAAPQGMLLDSFEANEFLSMLNCVDDPWRSIL